MPRSAPIDKPILLTVTTYDARTDLYVQAQIIDSGGSIIDTIELTHQILGVYGVDYTPTTEGYYTVYYQLYTDAGFTINAGYGASKETLDVNSFRTDMLRLLGLVHQDSVIDSQSYDTDGNLRSARIRCYDGAVNAAAASAISPAAYVTGQLFEYTVAATYSGGLLTKYTILKVL